MLFLFSILIYDLFFLHSVRAATVKVSVFPSTVTASVDQNFSIDVNIVNVLDLYAWEFKLSWNSSLVDLNSVVEGSFLKRGGTTYFSYKQNATVGYLIADCTLLGMIPGVSGNGTLATIIFHVKNQGECTLDLHDVLLLNSFELPIQCDTLDGYGYFTYQHDIAITDIDAAPLTVFPGDIVNINVTTQNQGAFAEVFNVTAYANSEIVGVKSVSLNSGASTIISFMWNTTGFGKGDYTISASASIIPGEVDTADNSGIANNSVTILYNGHDVAVIGFGQLKTIVGQGYYMNITVIVKNYGVFEETFYTTVYINVTSIQTKNVTLTSGAKYTINFLWDTASFNKANYTISAYIWPVSYETDTDNNMLVDGTVIVSIPCDITGPTEGVPDGVCNMRDIGYITNNYATTPSSPNWDPNCDVTGPVSGVPDGTVNMRDVGEACNRFQRT